MDIKYEVRTSKYFDKAVDDLKENLKKDSFGVLWEFNIKEKLKEKGLDFDTNFRVLEVCNPNKAKEVLEQNIEVGYFLPCKMVVYEKDGSTYIGMLKPTQLINMVGDESLVNVAKEIEEIMKKAIDETA